MRGSTVLICVTIIAVVAGVLGYVEYVRRDGLRREHVSQLGAEAVDSEQVLAARRSTLASTVGVFNVDHQARAEPDVDSADRHAVTAALDEVVQAYSHLCAVHQQAAEAGGQPAADASVAAYRSSIFDSTPGLDKIVRR